MLFKRRKPEDEIISLLGKGAEMTGEVSFTNGLRVEGIIRGKVRSEAILEIGPGGKVDAEVNIRRISINGEFHGVIHASDRVEIHRDGKVFGDVFSPCLIIEAGAIFDGHCNMSNEKKSAAKDERTASKIPEQDGSDKAL
jgi:cytoskeletal protein CcmA (bactofilin family)